MKEAKIIYVDRFIVIESLRPEDRKTGKDLFNDIIKRWTELINVGSHYQEVNSKEEFILTLKGVEKSICEIGITPYIHLEIHGNELGLEFNNGDFITWEEMAPYLRQINILLKNTLIISLATCFGAHIFSILNPVMRAPFYLYIGPVNRTSSGDLANDFLEYFNELLTQFDFNTALASLFRSDEKGKYMAYVSEFLYDDIIRAGWLKYDKEEMKENLLNAIKGKMPTKSQSEIESEVDALIEDRPALLMRLKNFFLMKDLQ